ncbi:MAG: NAD(P)/FAD-dependent oxidoreductase [Nitrososphaerota archaeon]
MKVDVVVVGGGAIGLIAAKTLAENNVESTLIEEHEEVGLPEHCAGLFSLLNFRRLGLPTMGKHVENIVRGAVFHSPKGREIMLDAGKTIAIVTSRKMLDSFLAHEYERRGGELILGERVVDLSFTNELVRVRTKSGLEVRAKKVIDAEGMVSALLKKTLKKTTERKMWIPIIQVWVENHSLDPRYVYLFFEEYLPEFFAYIIPVDDEVGKLGVASRTCLKMKLEKFITRRTPGLKIIRSVSHAVYTGRPLRPDSSSMIIPVGDVAGHVKASTGGGVVMGGLIARSICRIIASQLAGVSETASQDKRTIGYLIRELNKIASFMKLFRSLPIHIIERLFEIIDKSNLVEELSRKADMDFQFTSISRILMSPGILARLLFASLT